MQKEVRIKYKDVGSFALNNILQKIRNTPTNNKTASHINHVFKEVVAAQKQISEDYKKEIVEVFGKRDEKGALLKPENDKEGFVPPDQGTPEFEKFIKAQEELGEKVAVLKWGPIRPSHLADIKISAKEIDDLKDIFTEEEGPGVPNLEDIKMKLAR